MWRWITLDLLASIFSILGKLNYIFTDTNPPPLSSLNHCFFQFVVFPFSVSLSRLLPHELKAAEILDDNKVISTIPYKIKFCDTFIMLSKPLTVNSEFTQQDGRKKKTAERSCVTNVTRLFLTFFVVIFTWHQCFLVFYKKICLKKSEFWRKVISNKIIVTLVTQGLPSSFLSRPVA